MSQGREIRLLEEDDGWWSAIDEETGVASQGETREDALENLDEAVALHRGEIGEPIEDEEPFLSEIGIDLAEVPDLPERTQDTESSYPVPNVPWLESE